MITLARIWHAQSIPQIKLPSIRISIYPALIPTWSNTPTLLIWPEWYVSLNQVQGMMINHHRNCWQHIFPTKIINQSLCIGISPSIFKLGKVIPLYEKDDEKQTDKYRPISLLPSIAKIFEEVTFDQFDNYLSLHGLLIDSQCEFRKHITMTSWWVRWRLRSPASRLFIQTFIHAQIKENIKAPRHWPLCVEFTGDRWIPRTKGQ